MRLLTLLLAAAALAGCVYNQVEVRRLRAEVAALRAAQGERPAPSAAEERARALLRQSAEHSKRAQELLQVGKLEEASRELRKSLDLRDQAAEAAGGSDLVEEIRQSASRTAQRMEELISRLKRKSGNSGETSP